MSNLLYIIYAGVESKYLDAEYAVKWADDIILRESNPQCWLFDLSLCVNRDCVLNVIQQRMQAIGANFDVDYASVLIGFFYLNYLKGNISFDELEREVVDTVDAYELNDLDVNLLAEEFNLWRNSSQNDSSIELVLRKFGDKSANGLQLLGSE